MASEARTKLAEPKESICYGCKHWEWAIHWQNKEWIDYCLIDMPPLVQECEGFEHD